MRKIEENYQRIADGNRLFDIRFRRSRGDIAIFATATGLLS
jgi:hypothetical protein